MKKFLLMAAVAAGLSLFPTLVLEAGEQYRSGYGRASYLPGGCVRPSNGNSGTIYHPRDCNKYGGRHCASDYCGPRYGCSTGSVKYCPPVYEPVCEEPVYEPVCEEPVYQPPCEVTTPSDCYGQKYYGQKYYDQKWPGKGYNRTMGGRGQSMYGHTPGQRGFGGGSFRGSNGGRPIGRR